jgi:hypothetical protein
MVVIFIDVEILKVALRRWGVKGYWIGDVAPRVAGARSTDLCDGTGPGGYRFSHLIRVVVASDN